MVEQMIEDNTPTVNAKNRKPTRHQRLRLETVKKLRALGSKKKGTDDKQNKTKSNDMCATTTRPDDKVVKSRNATKIPARPPKVKKPTLATPPTPKAKFRKRQKHKAWLPTHIFHAKRAHMTPPSAPMWRFALPLSPTQKSYRSTHRASSERGAVCWDTSYMATIGLEGQERSVLGMLRALGVEEEWLRSGKGRNWRAGTRVLETVLYQREKPHDMIAPVTVIWSAAPAEDRGVVADEGKLNRKLFLRVHPSAFFEPWEELVRLSKVAKPGVTVEDLRFDLGSIEVMGPGSTEALLGALWPSPNPGADAKSPTDIPEKVWTELAGLTNAAMLPAGAMMAFDVQDPKLHFPPRTVKLPQTQDDQDRLLSLLADWPLSEPQNPPTIFDRKARQSGARLPSQKAVNRRKSLADPGEYAKPLSSDPRIPVLLYVSSSSKKKQQQSTSWHLLAPWKAIQPIWYSLMYYPLSTGQQPRFGGLNEQIQLAFEASTPWFPGDFPRTKAGWEWEMMQRRRRWEEWKKRPKAKRVSWEAVQVGEGKEGKGEVGVGWACDWEMLLDPTGNLKPSSENKADGQDTAMASTERTGGDGSKQGPQHDAVAPSALPKPKGLTHISASSALALLKDPTSPLPNTPTASLLNVRIALLTRGTPQTCARIYRLPSATTNSDLRKAWLALHPSNSAHHEQSKKHTPLKPSKAKDTAPHILQQRLAASLLEPPKADGESYPFCPGKEDLIGFVTSGWFNLAEGKGTGVGCLLFSKVVDGVKANEEEGRLCIVRNSGESVGRLGRWEMV